MSMQQSIKITILSLSIFLLINSNSYASTDNSTANRSASAFVEKYEKAIGPLLGAAAGYINNGFWGAIPGLVFGAIDEAMIHFGVYKKHYITYGMFGMAAGGKIGQAMFQDAITPDWYEGTGMLIGLLSSQPEALDFITDNAKNLAKLATDCHTGIMAGSLVDDMIKREGVYGKVVPGLTLAHLIGSTIFRWTNANYTQITNLLFNDQTESNFKQLEITIKMLNDLNNKVYPGFVSQDKIAAYIEKQFLTSIGSELITRFLSVSLVKNEKEIKKYFDASAAEKTALKQIGNGAVMFAVFMLPKTLVKLGSDVIHDYLDRNFGYEIKDSIDLQLYSDQNMLRISRDKKLASLVGDKDRIIDGLTAFTSRAVTDATGSAVEIYGTSAIIISSPDLFLYSLMYKRACSWIASSVFSTDKSRYNIYALEDQLNRHNIYIASNAVDIAVLGSQEVEKAEGIRKKAELRKAQEAKKFLAFAQDAFWSIPQAIGNKLGQYIVAKAVDNKLIAPSKKDDAIMNFNKNIQSMHLNQQYQTIQTINNLRNILIIQGIVYDNRSSTDKIVREQTQEDKLILDNIELKTAEKTLFKLDHIELEMGKKYAVTGTNGAGKTSLMRKIKGLTEDGIAGSGSILYPKTTNQNKIIMVQKNDALHDDHSLMQIFEYLKNSHQGTKGPLNIEEKQYLSDLLTEGGFLNKLDSDRRWSTYSDGEKNKVLIIAAILNSPKILILDESFGCLDANSLATFKGMLNKYLPKSLIIVIDHQVKNYDNINADHFYDQEIHFASGQVELKDF